MIQFSYLGNDISIELGIPARNPVVTVLEHRKQRLREFTIIGTKDINLGEIKGHYRLRTFNMEGGRELEEFGTFEALSQEDMMYFFLLTFTGEDFFKKLVSGLLIDQYRIGRHGCYGTDGKFYQPIGFDYSVSRGQPFLLEPAREAELDIYGEVVTPAHPDVYSYTATVAVNVSDGPNDGYIYRLSGFPAQGHGVFTGVPKGTYTLVVTSPKSMPAERVIEI